MHKFLLYISFTLVFLINPLCSPKNNTSDNVLNDYKQQILKSNIYEHKQRDYTRPDWFVEARKKGSKQAQYEKKYSKTEYVEKFQVPTIPAPRYEITQIPDAL